MFFDGDEYDVGWNREVFHGSLCQSFFHECQPRRQCGLGSRFLVAKGDFLVVADPDSGSDSWVETDEPRVGVVVCRAGLATQGATERSGPNSRASLYHASQEAGDNIGRVGPNGRECFGMGLFEQDSRPYQ